MRLWAGLRVPAELVEQRDPASEADVKGPFSVLPRDAFPSLNNLIRIVLMFSRQTVTRLWQRLPLTSNSSQCGGQIVANLILTNVCLPFLWAVREDVFQTSRPCQRWHHAVLSPHMSSTAAGCWRGWHEKKKKSRKPPPRKDGDALRMHASTGTVPCVSWARDLMERVFSL